MQTLSSTKSGRGSFNRGARHIIKRILLCKRPATGLTMCSKRKGFWILRIELFYNFCPKHTGSTHFCDFHKVIHSYSPKKGEARSKIIDLQSGFNSCADIFQTICQSICQFNICSGTCFLHMIARNRNAVKLGHMLSGIFKNIRNNTHRRGWRIDVCIPNHKFLKDIILNRALQLFGLNALFFGSYDVKCQNRKYRAVHRHRNAHFVQRDLIKQ